MTHLPYAAGEMGRVVSGLAEKFQISKTSLAEPAKGLHIEDVGRLCSDAPTASLRQAPFKVKVLVASINRVIRRLRTIHDDDQIVAALGALSFRVEDFYLAITERSQRGSVTYLAGLDDTFTASGNLPPDQVEGALLNLNRIVPTLVSGGSNAANELAARVVLQVTTQALDDPPAAARWPFQLSRAVLEQALNLSLGQPLYGRLLHRLGLALQNLERTRLADRRFSESLTLLRGGRDHDALAYAAGDLARFLVLRADTPQPITALVQESKAAIDRSADTKPLIGPVLASALDLTRRGSPEQALAQLEEWRRVCCGHSDSPTLWEYLVLVHEAMALSATAQPEAALRTIGLAKSHAQEHQLEFACKGVDRFNPLVQDPKAMIASYLLSP